MRLLLALLCCTLMGCSAVQAAPPNQPKPSQESAESLYRVFALHAMIKDIFQESIRKGEANELPGNKALISLLTMSAMLQQANDLLGKTYPASLANNVKVATSQHNAIVSINDRWFRTKTLSSVALKSELDAITADYNILLYTDHLLSLGFSHDDIEMMDVRLKDDLILIPN